MQFRELPWRVAQLQEMLYASYVQACAKSDAVTGPCPATLKDLQPRNCRPIIRKLLEPDPRKRWTVKEAIANSWMEGVEVCTMVDNPTHVHAHVRVMLKQHAEKLAEHRRERE
jgi:protein-serine/threonine kinase